MTGDRTPLRERLASAIGAAMILRTSVDEIAAAALEVVQPELAALAAGTPRVDDSRTDHGADVQSGDLRERLAEAVGLARNGPASDGRGWYRTAGDRQECLAVADAVLPVVEAETAALRDTIERIRELTEQPYGAVYDLAADIRAEIKEIR